MTRIFLLLFTGIAFLLAVIIGLTLYDQNRVERQANELVMAVTAEPLRQWDSQLIIDNAHPSMLDEAPEGFYPLYFTNLRGLGNLLEIRDITYELELAPWWEPYQPNIAHYAMTAIFDYGEAEIRVSLLREGGRWTITEYLVLTPMMAA